MAGTRSAVDPAQAAKLAELVMRVGRSADRAAFIELFNALAPKVKGYMRRLGSDEAAAEDLAQEVLVSVWRRAGLFDPAQATVTTWVYTIARNRRIDGLRHDRLPALDPTADRVAGPLADQLIHLAQQESRLRKALAALPPEQAEAIDWFFYGDKTYSQIAAERGIPIGTIKSRVRLAVGRLRKVLDGALDEIGDDRRPADVRPGPGPRTS